MKKIIALALIFSSTAFGAAKIQNADIKANANIARSKLASGTANRVVVNNGSGVMSDAAAITANRAIASDANGIPTASAASDTELGYLSGVTSAIQTQLDVKQPLDGDLTAIAALSGTGTIYYRSAANTWSAVTIGTGLDFTDGTLSSTGGSGSGESVSKSFTQTAHGFSVGNVIYNNAGTWAKAKADADATSETIGMVSSVADTDNFTLTTGGYISGLSGFTAGSTYYLSDATAGALTSTEPTTANHFSCPLFVADSTTSGYFFKMRCAEIQSQGANVIGSWTTYTPTFTGFGTVATQSFQYKVIGDTLYIHGTFTAGTPTATEARISLPTGYTSSANITNAEPAGIIGANANSASYFGSYALIEASKTYLTMSQQGSATNILTKQNGNVVSAGQLMSVKAEIPLTP